MRISLPSFKKTALTLALPFLMSQLSYANCEYQLFNISSAKGITIEEFVDQLSNECDYSIIITDPEAEKIVKKNLQKTTLKNLTISEVLDIVLLENNLKYSLENNVLKISYLITKTFQLDYLISKRASKSSNDVTLSSQTATETAGTGNTTSNNTDNTDGASTEAQPQTGVKIFTQDEVNFWHELDQEFESILNRPEDDYKADAPIINKNAGMVTVTATLKQMKRLNDYINSLQQKMQQQVLIDVHMLLVTFSDERTTGIDWSQLYALQNLSVKGEYISKDNVPEFSDGKINLIGDQAKSVANILTVSGEASIKEIIKFLNTQGDVHTVSNPKVLTLNNQPALISVGTEFFYKIQQSTNQQGSGGGVAATTQNDVVNSVFAGVLLDITPEISNDKTITLKINPSISRTVQNLSTATDGSDRTVPPDLNRRQLASVVTVKDGTRVVLGGLISTDKSTKMNKVPLLGDIPGLGYLFKYTNDYISTEELIMVIEPHIINREKNEISIAELGYERMDSEILTSKRLKETDGK